MSLARTWTQTAPRAVAPLPRTVLRVALSLLYVLALGVAVHALQPALNRPVSAIDVRGQLTHLTPREIAAAAAVAPGTRLFDVGLTRVRERVEALPWVASAAVTRRWPGALEVSVVERQPIARWGTAALLDRQGRAFTPASHDLSAAQRAALPALSGEAGHEDDVLAAWNELAPALAMTPLAIASLSEDDRGGFSAVTSSGITLRLGSGDPARRLPMIRDAVLPALGGKLAGVGTIDLRYTNGFAVASRGAPAKQEKQS